MVNLDQSEIVLAVVGASGGYVLKSIAAWVAKLIERDSNEQRALTSANSKAIIELNSSMQKHITELTGTMHNLNFRLDMISKNLALIPAMKNKISEQEARIREMGAKLNDDT